LKNMSTMLAHTEYNINFVNLQLI